MATYNIDGVPAAAVTEKPTVVVSGGASTLTWSSTNATSCTASGGTFAGAKAISGSQSTGALTANTTYSFTCTGTGGTSTAGTATGREKGRNSPAPRPSKTNNPTAPAGGCRH